MHRFFVDAESDGLYGSVLSVAALVTDEENRELCHFYGAVSPEQTEIRSPWVRMHVLPMLGMAEEIFPTEAALTEAFWQFWLDHRKTCQCIADVGVPVEARLFSLCVRRDPQVREFLGPYPLLDLSTLLLARGIDPLSDRATLSGLALTPHDPLNDVRMAAKIWHQAISKTNAASPFSK